MATSEQKRQSNLIMGLIVFVGIILGYIFYSQSADVVLPPDDMAQESRDTLLQFKSINFNFAVLQSPLLRTLRVFGESPVNIGTPGKDNIFAP